MFHQLLDDQARPYFTYLPPSPVQTLNLSETPYDLASFLSSEMPISRRVTGLFSSDLTSRDEEIIAVLSLFFLLTIEAIAATILLRTSNGAVSNPAFSVKHATDMIRDFHLRNAIRSKRPAAKHASLNYSLLTVAVIFLLLTFSAELLVLILTNPTMLPVPTSAASLGLVQPIAPLWKDVRDQVDRSTTRPCSVISLRGVHQGETRIGTCLSADLPIGRPNIFENSPANVSLKIVSDLHRFGAEHTLQYGNATTKYSARAYMTSEHLTPGKQGPVPRILGERPATATHPTEYDADSVYLVHKLYTAYLLSAYVRATDDESIGLQTLRNMRFESAKPTSGADYNIIKINGKEKFTTVASRQFTTTFRGVPDVGAMAAMRFAQTVLRAGMGLIVAEADDESDLDMGSGVVEVVPVDMWMEDSRTANVVAVGTALAGALGVLAVMRLALKPVATVEIARMCVEKAGRINGEEEEEEEEEERGYRYGAGSEGGGDIGEVREFEDSEEWVAGGDGGDGGESSDGKAEREYRYGAGREAGVGTEEYESGERESQRRVRGSFFLRR